MTFDELSEKMRVAAGDPPPVKPVVLPPDWSGWEVQGRMLDNGKTIRLQARHSGGNPAELDLKVAADVAEAVTAAETTIPRPPGGPSWVSNKFFYVALKIGTDGVLWLPGGFTLPPKVMPDLKVLLAQVMGQKKGDGSGHSGWFPKDGIPTDVDDNDDDDTCEDGGCDDDDSADEGP